MESSEYNGAGKQFEEADTPNPTGEASESTGPGGADTMANDAVVPSRKEIFDNLRYDYKVARNAKAEIDDLIAKWNDLYEGKPFGNEMKNRSKIVVKDVAKQIEWQKPNITEPFTGATNPVKCAPVNAGSAQASKIGQKWLNYTFTTEFPRYKFVNDVADVFSREGTVWIRTGWEFAEEVEERTVEGLSMDELVNMNIEPDDVVDNGDGTYDAVFRRRTLKYNRPTAEICRNEHVFPDPAADTEEEMNFICYRFEDTLSSIKTSPFYDEAEVDKLRGKAYAKYNDTALGSLREADLEAHGRDTHYQSKDPAMQRITLIEYWGYYDIDGDGIAEPVVATWADDFDILLRLEENPLPTKRIPFHNAVYASKPFSLWGNALAYFLEDNQKVRSSIMRGIIDNMSAANNGQKFFQKGALDYVNYKRMRNGERYIQTNMNPKEMLHEGGYNQLPPSVFTTMQMVTQETQELSGIQSNGPALDPNSMNRADTGATGMVMTMAQQRMADAVRNLAALLTNMFEDWLAYAKEFLEEDQIRSLFGEIPKEAMNGQYHVRLSVSTELNKQVQIQQLNLLLQQSQAMGQSAPPEVMNAIVAEMFDLFDKPDLADALRGYKPQPDPMQVQMSQLEMQKLQAEINKLNAEAQTDILYKQAQSKEKIAKATMHEMETVLAPQQLVTDAYLKNKEAKTKQFDAIQKAKQGEKQESRPNQNKAV